ncbi:MAG: hypothetical protein E7649_00455 [Ruminococcaceae bacterium]|nr:hypothetical protein [Oscillospiraceae bacterium]
MSEFKKIDTEEKKLKMADARKMSDADQAGAVSELLSGKKARGNTIMTPIANNKKKKFPIVVDVIVGIAMLAIVAGLLVGAYLLFTHYSNDYEGVGVEYKIVCAGEDLASFATINNGDLYCDVEGNTLYFGKVKSITQEESGGLKMFVLQVAVDGVKYKDGEGYYISSEKLAVGAYFTFRCGEKEIAGTVVELEKSNKGGK